ncbi:hypothetical protein GCM10009664_22750 [Kitasatospora gansuensis]
MSDSGYDEDDPNTTTSTSFARAVGTSLQVVTADGSRSLGPLWGHADERGIRTAELTSANWDDLAGEPTSVTGEARQYEITPT